VEALTAEAAASLGLTRLLLRPQAFYAQAEQIEELKRSATFPKLTPPSPDFLGMMEEYVEAAPRPADGAGSKV